jgi:H+-transporting ATPase
MNAPRLLLAIERGAGGAQALRVACEMARTLGAEVALVAVVDPQRAIGVEGGLPVDELMAGLRREGEQLLDEGARAFGAEAKVWKVLREGEAALHIGQCAQEWNADYIVIGAGEGPSGVAEAVIRGARCPVIVVPRPPEEVASAPEAEPARSEAIVPALAEGDRGLTERQAAGLLTAHGPNEIPEPRRSAIGSFLKRFWGPVPWTLEAALVAVFMLGRWRQAVIIGALLVLNAVVSAFYEERAAGALRALRRRLTIHARVKRDGAWVTRAARDVVPGDVVRLRPGDVVPADLWLLDGTVLLDYSTLTGEALPVEAGAGAAAHSGTTVRRGEATGQATATGLRTVFGTTAALVREAEAPGHLHTLMLRIVRLLAAVALIVAVAVAIAAPMVGISWREAASLGIALFIVAMPLSLPIMVTLTGAVGARDLAARGILLTRLSAIQDCAAMDILFVDKTGTLTSNKISVERLVCVAGSAERDVLLGAAAASTAATLDPLDVATLHAAAGAGIDPAKGTVRDFVPFETMRRMCEGTLELDGRTVRGVKGAAATVAAMVESGGDEMLAQAERLGATGGRVLGVAIAEPPGAPLRAAGLILFADPPRPDSAAMVSGLRDLGVRVAMVTGDSLPAAASVAARVGIGQRGRASGGESGAGPVAMDADIHAGINPAEKVSLVRGFQNIGHVVGMTGDGVNDARALRQADMGIAVDDATDVARTAAGVVLTEPGLVGVVEAVKIGRVIQQRVVTYILSMIARKAVIVAFMAVTLLTTAQPPTHPAQVLLLVLIHVFLTLSLATDRVAPSPTPDHWSTRPIAVLSLSVAALWTGLLVAIYLIGRRWLGLTEPEQHTFAFILLVLAGQCVVFNVRERGWMWSSRPGRWVLAMWGLGAAAAAGVAIGGILMEPLPAATVLALYPVVLGCMLVVDVAKKFLLSKQTAALG